MSWEGLTRMTKIEVVLDGEHAPAVRDLFLRSGATGYTAVDGVSGFGHRGYHQGRLLFNDRASLSLLITVVPEERVESIVEGILKIIEGVHGVLFVTEVHVSRPEYFLH